MSNFNFNVENKNIHFSAWFVFECKTDSVLIQTQEIWHEKSDQECVSENTQQAAVKKISSAAAINANQKKDQNSMNKNMIEKWASEKSSDIQNAAQQMKTAMKNKEIWMRATRNQKTEMCCN